MGGATIRDSVVRMGGVHTTLSIYLFGPILSAIHAQFPLTGSLLEGPVLAVPLEAAMSAQLLYHSSSLLSASYKVGDLLNRVVDLVFTLDMIFQFFISYQMSLSASEMQSRRFSPAETVWVDNRAKIAMRYLSDPSRFWFDLFTLVPSLFDILPTFDGIELDSGVLGNVSFVRTLRVLVVGWWCRMERALHEGPRANDEHSPWRVHSP